MYQSTKIFYPWALAVAGWACVALSAVPALSQTDTNDGGGEETVSVNLPSMPGVALDKVYATMTPNRKPLESVTVTNTSDAPLNVVVQVVEITEKTQSQETTQPATAVKVSPSRFTLPPRGDRLTRLIFTEPFGPQERLFRVRYLPVAEALNAAESAASLQTKVQVQVGMGLLLAVSPEKQQPGVTFKREATGVKITNTGNVHVMFRRSRYCPDNAAGGCIDLPGARVYPGLTWHAPIKTNAPLVLPYQVYGTELKLNIPAR